MYSYFKHLQCPECGKRHSGNRIQTVCRNSECLSTLFSCYAMEGLKPSDVFIDHEHSMWRYGALMPVVDPANIISLGEGLTPVLPLERLNYKGRKETVFIKDESCNPTGSFKARGLSAALSKAKELGIKEVSIPTAGNAGGALAAYCARGNMQAHVFMPRDTPKIFKIECEMYGAELIEINGNISDCGKACSESSLTNGWFQISTLKEPYRVEGKKTMGYEIAEQFRWDLPDVILYPTGGGTGLVGIWKAFDEMQSFGWIGSKRPKMIAVQSVSCNGIAEAYEQKKSDSKAVDRGFTIANGLRVPKPYASKIILKILKESGGSAIAIDDYSIEKAMKEIAKKEGMLIAPEGAALWAAFKNLVDKNYIKEEENVLLLNTGNGYKYLENISVHNAMPIENIIHN